MIESLAPGTEITKTFQVFINETGTHAIELELPPDSLSIDNTRVCTLPLSDVERVLVIDSDPDESGAYTVSAVLNPGSQVRIGAVPEIKPPRIPPQRDKRCAVRLPRYLFDRLAGFVRNGSNGVGRVRPWRRRHRVGAGGKRERRYRTTAYFFPNERHLLPGPLVGSPRIWGWHKATTPDRVTSSFGDDDTFLDPLKGAGNGSMAMIGLAKSWSIANDADMWIRNRRSPELSFGTCVGVTVFRWPRNTPLA